MPYSVPALDQNDIYFVSTEGRIVKRDVVAHANRWTFGGAAPFSDVIVSNNRVYVTGPNSTIVARDKNSGKLIWSRDIPGDGNVRLSMIRGMLFARSESVTRLDPVNGAVLWRAQTGRVDKVVAPASVFAAIAEGSPIQESISVIDSASGRIVAEYNPGGPAGIARILEAQGDAVLVHAAATGATIDEDGYALTKLVWLDSVTGQMMRSWSYRPDAKSHGPDTMIATPIIDNQTVVFQSGGSIYRYDLKKEPASQRPFRIQGAGDLIAARGGRLYTRTSDGLYVIEFDGQRAIRRHALPYRYDAALNQPALVQAGDTIAVSDGSTIQVLDLLTNQVQRYSAPCGGLLDVVRFRSLVALQCQRARASQSSAYLVRLPSRN